MYSLSRRLVFFALLSVVLAAWSHPDISTVVGSSRAGVVKIRIENSTDFQNSGSGFVVTSEGYVITAAHLLPDDKSELSIWGRLANERVSGDNPAQETRLDLIKFDVGTDVALLKFRSIPNGMRPLAINPFVPTDGERLYVLGFAGGQDLMTRDDVVAEIDYPYIGSPETSFQYHGVANQGNSGGPILDEDGSVVGIVSRDVPSINNVPVSGVHLAVKSESFILPEDFFGPNIRPIYFPTRYLLNFREEDLEPDGWDTKDDRQLIASLTSGEVQQYCGMSVNNGEWIFVKNERGFVLQAKHTNSLGSTKIAFAATLITRGDPVEYYTDDQKYIIPPFGGVPNANQSFVMQNYRTVNSRGALEFQPLTFTEIKNRYTLINYISRHYSLDFQGDRSYDTVVAVCSAGKPKISGKVFFSLCETLMQQFSLSYTAQGSDCLPETDTQK